MNGAIVNDTGMPRLGCQLAGKPGQTTGRVWADVRRQRARMLLLDVDVIPGTERWHREMRDGVVFLGWSAGVGPTVAGEVE